MPYTRFITDASLDDVVGIMARYIDEGSRDPYVQQLALIASNGKSDKIGAVFDFVRGTFPYLPDPSYELFISPHRIAQDYLGGTIRGFDCDDSAPLTAAMLRSLGYSARVVLVGRDSEIDHAIAEVKMPDGWLMIDTTSRMPLGWHTEYSIRVAAG